MRLLIIVWLLAACTTSPDPSPSTAPLDAVEDVCGSMPLEPGFAVDLESGSAQLSANDWAAIQQFLTNVDAWRVCAETPSSAH